MTAVVIWGLFALVVVETWLVVKLFGLVILLSGERDSLLETMKRITESMRRSNESARNIIEKRTLEMAGRETEFWN